MNRRDFIQASMLSGLMLAQGFARADTKKSETKFKLLGTDVNGKKLDLEAFKGNAILLSFFTYDCPLCSHDLKLMREFYVRNSKKKFTLIGVNVDQSKKELDEYNEATTLAYPKDQRFPTVWRNAPGHNDNFGKIITKPTHFFLDTKHQLVIKREGTFLPDDWDQLWLSLG
jgi:peroxiredoxin